MPQLTAYNQQFLEKSWIWLRDPEIKALTLTPDFTREEQLAFYHSLPERKNYWIRGILEDGVPVGAMGLKHISSTTAEYWGYIGEKAYWGKGIGSFMIAAAVEKAKQLGLTAIYLQ